MVRSHLVATVAIVTVLGFAVHPGAAARASSRDPNDCSNYESTYDIVTCEKRNLAVADAALAKAYQAALAALPSDQQLKLKQSQAQWKAFRDADCGVYYGTSTGTYASIAAGNCMIEHTRSRIPQLQAFLIQ